MRMNLALVLALSGCTPAYDIDDEGFFGLALSFAAFDAARVTTLYMAGARENYPDNARSNDCPTPVSATEAEGGRRVDFACDDPGAWSEGAIEATFGTPSASEVALPFEGERTGALTLGEIGLEDTLVGSLEGEGTLRPPPDLDRVERAFEWEGTFHYRLEGERPSEWSFSVVAACPDGTIDLEGVGPGAPTGRRRTFGMRCTPLTVCAQAAFGTCW